MAWVWNPVGILGLIAGAATLAVAGLVYWASPRRLQNRLLTILLALNGIGSVAGIGLMYLTSDRDATYAWQLVGSCSFAAMTFLYLAFLSTLATPLARPLARVRLVLYAAAVFLFLLVILDPKGFITGTKPGTFSPWDATLGPWWVYFSPIGIGVSLVGIGFALSAYRRATGDLARSQALAYLLAFAWADTRIILEALANLFIGFVQWVGVADALASLVFPALLTYGILKTQLFDIDLRVKWTIRRGTVVAAFVGVFFVVAKLTESWAERTFGQNWVVGAVAAGLLLFALSPLQRWAERLSDKAMPNVRDSSAYRDFRKLEVYQAAVEELAVGGVTAKERRALDALREKLGLAMSDATEMERDVVAARGVA